MNAVFFTLAIVLAAASANAISYSDMIMPQARQVGAVITTLQTPLPTSSTEETPATETAPAPVKTWFSTIKTALQPVASRALAIGTKVGFYLLNIVAVVIVAGLLTSGVCTFTPLCSVVAGHMMPSNQHVKELVESFSDSYVTPEKMDNLVKIVYESLRKYSSEMVEPAEPAHAVTATPLDIAST